MGYYIRFCHEGNVCDDDKDDDGITDVSDNCPVLPNPQQIDSDGESMWYA